LVAAASVASAEAVPLVVAEAREDSNHNTMHNKRYRVIVAPFIIFTKF
jgi:hypothetical protein